MPQPDSVERLAEELIRLYRTSWDRITTAEQALINSWTGYRRQERLARLKELQAAVEALMDTADEHALRFTQTALPEIYMLGAAASGLGLSPWAQSDIDAIGVVATDTYEGLLAATTFVRNSTKDLIRTMSREHIADKLITGQTAQQAARELAGSLEGRGIAAVVYKNGARHGLADYADMLVRTKSAEAYSVATLTQIERAGIGWVEVFDGVGCGWTRHDDPDKANGTVRSLRECQQAPVSHPRCRRAFGARPDVTSAHDAAQARASTTASQQADQAEAEARRELDVAARASSRSFDSQVQRRANALLSDASNRVRSPAHAAVLARRAAKLARRRSA
jgi:hypothetical protein